MTPERIHELVLFIRLECGHFTLTFPPSQIASIALYPEMATLIFVGGGGFTTFDNTSPGYRALVALDAHLVERIAL